MQFRLFLHEFLIVTRLFVVKTSWINWLIVSLTWLTRIWSKCIWFLFIILLWYLCWLFIINWLNEYGWRGCVLNSHSYSTFTISLSTANFLFIISVCRSMLHLDDYILIIVHLSLSSNQLLFFATNVQTRHLWWWRSAQYCFLSNFITLCLFSILLTLFRLLEHLVIVFSSPTCRLCLFNSVILSNWSFLSINFHLVNTCDLWIITILQRWWLFLSLWLFIFCVLKWILTNTHYYFIISNVVELWIIRTGLSWIVVVLQLWATL